MGPQKRNRGPTARHVNTNQTRVRMENHAEMASSFPLPRPYPTKLDKGAKRCPFGHLITFESAGFKRAGTIVKPPDGASVVRSSRPRPLLRVTRLARPCPRAARGGPYTTYLRGPGSRNRGRVPLRY